MPLVIQHSSQSCPKSCYQGWFWEYIYLVLSSVCFPVVPPALPSCHQFFNFLTSKWRIRVTRSLGWGFLNDVEFSLLYLAENCPTNIFSDGLKPAIGGRLFISTSAKCYKFDVNPFIRLHERPRILFRTGKYHQTFQVPKMEVVTYVSCK